MAQSIMTFFIDRTRLCLTSMPHAAPTPVAEFERGALQCRTLMNDHFGRTLHRHRPAHLSYPQKLPRSFCPLAGSDEWHTARQGNEAVPAEAFRMCSRGASRGLVFPPRFQAPDEL